MDGAIDGADRALRAELVRARARVSDLSDELLAIEESTAAVPDDEHDPEGSTVGYERVRVGSLLTRATQDVTQLEAALDRLAGGSYQQCARCGATIDPQRLVALPATTTCIACAAKPPDR